MKNNTRAIALEVSVKVAVFTRLENNHIAVEKLKDYPWFKEAKIPSLTSSIRNNNDKAQLEILPVTVNVGTDVDIECETREGVSRQKFISWNAANC